MRFGWRSMLHIDNLRYDLFYAFSIHFARGQWRLQRITFALWLTAADKAIAMFQKEPWLRFNDGQYIPRSGIRPGSIKFPKGIVWVLFVGWDDPGKGRGQRIVAINILL